MKTIYTSLLSIIILSSCGRNTTSTTTKEDSTADLASNIVQLTKEQASKTCLVMHTHVKDEHGTDLEAVRDMIFGKEGGNIIFSQGKQPAQVMNLLYNACM